MSSGWPPEEDDRRWEPVRHPSAVGAAHDSGDAARGYSGYAHYAPGDGANGGQEPGEYEVPGYGAPGYEGANGYGDMPSYGGAGWAAPAPRSPDGSGGYAVSHLSRPPGPGHDGGYDLPDGADGADGYGAEAAAGEDGQARYYGEIGYGGPGEPDQGGHGGQQGYAHVTGAPGYPDGGYGSTGYDASLYAEPRYDDAGYQQPGNADAGYADAGYADAGYADGAPGYQDGYGAQRGYETGQAGYGAGGQDGGYGQESYQPDGYGSGGYPAAGEGYGHDVQQDTGYSGGYVAEGVGYANAGYAATYQPQGYDHRDYGDPRYDDPGYGDPGYEDAQYAGSGYDDAGGPALSGQAAGSSYGAPVYAGEDYAAHTGQPGESLAGGYGPGGGYDPGGHGQPGSSGTGYGEDPGLGQQAGYAGPGYAGQDYQGYSTGDFAEGFDGRGGMLGETPAGLPDPAATGMLNTGGMLGASGPSGAAAFAGRAGLPAGTGFLEASGPMRALGGTGIFDSSEFPVVEGRDAGSATGVLESDVAELFADAPPAETTSFDIPAAAGAGAGGGAAAGGGVLTRGKMGRLARSGSARSTAKPAGRRRGRSGDRRLWAALGGVMAAAVVAIVAIILVGFGSGPGGPAHALTTPGKLGSFVRRPALEQQMNVGQLRQDVVSMSSGQAKHVVEAVYENGTSTSGQTPQIILFIGGNLANASPTASVKSFTQKFKGAKVTGAGPLGGEAACVNATASEPGSVAMCAWFDNDSFGEVVSPTMNAAALASTMRTIRPDVEKVVPAKP